MGCYLLFRFLINETNPSPTSRIPFGTFGVFFSFWMTTSPRLLIVIAMVTRNKGPGRSSKLPLDR
eukprot:UN07309